MGGKRLPALLKPAWKIPQPENAKRLRDKTDTYIEVLPLSVTKHSGAL